MIKVAVSTAELADLQRKLDELKKSNALPLNAKIDRMHELLDTWMTRTPIKDAK